MHVRTKQLAISGLLAAVSAVLMVLSSVIETNSLFLIAAASFGVGITIREWGIPSAWGYYIASSLLNLLVTPNKYYCVTYAMMGMYILLTEWLWEKIAESGYLLSYRMTLLWLGKYLVFNAMYIPAVLFLQDLLFSRRVQSLGIALVIVVGQVAVFIFDSAYRYFQSAIWGRIRIKIMG